ncbi:MAG TPA: hypothetical protein VK745_11835, partial [Polyangiaceae bacterium]|nr:hypothetical protein [Polyangiaceae bacterium]
VRKLVPQFLTRDEARFTAFVAGLEPLARKYSSSPMLFAERALVAAGMPAAEAHERFTFLRVKSSRDAKAKQSRARKAPSPRSTPRR